MSRPLVVFGSFGNKDIGDEAMLTEDLRYIRDILKIPDSQVYLIGTQPDYLRYYHQHPKSNCLGDAWFKFRNDIEGPDPVSRLRKAWWSVRDLIHPDPALTLIRQARAALITGGGTVNTRDQHARSLKRMHAFVMHCRSCGVPVFMSGQTIGPLGVDPHHDRLARQIIKSVDVLTVRDALYSRRYLDILGTKPKKLLETYDDAYTLSIDDISLNDTDATLASFIGERRTIALNVTLYTADTKEKRDRISSISEDLINTFNCNLVFVSHTPDDYQHLLMIYDDIENDLKNFIRVPDTRLWRDASLKKLISECFLAIGGRYHFIVFSGTSNTPFVGMCGNHYSYIKQDGFARQLGLQDFILTEKQTWDHEYLMSTVEKATKLKLDFKDKFAFPGESMRLFGKWLEEHSR